MKGFAEIDKLFQAFPMEWFRITTIAKYGRVTAPHARSILAVMIEHGQVQAKKMPQKHAQATFYGASEANRKRYVLRNQKANRKILAG